MFGWSYPAGCSSTHYDVDIPEKCPCCGGENMTEGGVEIYKADPAFCSEKCAKEWTAKQVESDVEYAESFNTEPSADEVAEYLRSVA